MKSRSPTSDAELSDQLSVSSAFDEEMARAEMYGLLAQLYYAPPSAELLGALRLAAAEAPDPGAFLQEPWREVVGMARQMSCEAVNSEYQELFGGVGKPEVYLFGSHYLCGALNDKPLARLRTDLAGLGLERDDVVTETEDHLACLCEVMRYLIAGDDVAVADLSRQRDFFATHVQSWVPSLCDTLAAHPGARFYAVLAGLTRAFVSVEAQGFDMLAWQSSD
jgi:TorA maturation chaperone TorD